jgi:hypothetical protein
MIRAVLLLAGLASPAWASEEFPKFIVNWDAKANPDGKFDPLAIADSAAGDVYVIHRYQHQDDFNKDKKKEN